jgi:uncharacterized membrane protein
MKSSRQVGAHHWDDALGIPGTERLLTLTDGVVAIALTLLVLQLQIPILPKGTADTNSAALWHQLTDSNFTSLLVAYLVSFYVIAQFWLAHHRTYRLVRGHSEAIAWWNFAFLLTITLFPFSSELLGKYPDNRVAVVEFASNLLLASLATTLTLAIARRQQMLVPEATPYVLASSRVRGIFSAAVILLSIGAAFLSPTNAKYVWLLLALAPTANRVVEGRWLSQRDVGDDTAPSPAPGESEASRGPTGADGHGEGGTAMDI